MSDKDFIQWMRGFVEGVHHYNLTPKQWDYLKEKLQTVERYNQPIYSYTVGESWITNIA